MKNLLGLFLIGLTLQAYNQENLNNQSAIPVVGFCISAPEPENLDEFINFIENDLAVNEVNTLVLMVNYNYQFKSVPKLADPEGLSEQDAKKLLAACRKHNIRLVPQVNLLGHQSWASSTGKLLREFPEFDETPHVKMPEKYEWPNEDGLYCKSYCPLHPGVHDVVFAIVDEIMDVFEADAFHAGMDEVFYIGDDQCPRCSGKDKAELFAGEVRAIHSHLQQKNRELWIWGDRLLDGNASGLGMWEASTNETHPAIDMIPKDVVIWDWHYENAEPSAVMFAMKGFRVVSCVWNRPQVAAKQVDLTKKLREYPNPEIASRIRGVAQTIWTSAENFLESLENESDQQYVRSGASSYRQMILSLKE